MKWVNDYQLFLFDFDGLLVSTEELHYQAYLDMCKNRGYTLPWDFNRFCDSAHTDSKTLRKDIYSALPELQKEAPDFEILYKEKKDAYIQILKKAPVTLMPGVEDFLKILKNHHSISCVVTNSTQEQIDLIKLKNPVLNSIPYYITREDYLLPKPNPECYLKAISLHSKPGDKVIGFEDTPKGILALVETSAESVLIASAMPEKLESLINEKKISHYNSFYELLEKKT